MCNDAGLLRAHARVRPAVMWVVVVLAACAARGTLSVSSTIGREFDRSLFRAIVLDIMQHGVRGTLRVDPHPLAPDPTVTYGGAADRAGVSRADVRAAASVLAELHVATADSAAMQHCPGYLLPPDSAIAEQRRRYCPDQDESVVAVGLPRKGGAYYPYSTLDNRREGAARHEFAVRVITVERGPRGSEVDAYDYVVRRDANGWHIVDRVALLILH
jgi:hypothetical protein